MITGVEKVERHEDVDTRQKWERAKRRFVNKLANLVIPKLPPDYHDWIVISEYPRRKRENRHYLVQVVARRFVGGDIEVQKRTYDVTHQPFWPFRNTSPGLQAFRGTFDYAEVSFHHQHIANGKITRTSEKIHTGTETLYQGSLFIEGEKFTLADQIAMWNEHVAFNKRSNPVEHQATALNRISYWLRDKK